MNINLHIDTLTLTGFDYTAQQQVLFQDALHSQLHQLLSQPDAIRHTHDTHLEFRRTPHVQLQANSTPAQVGQQVAYAIWGSIQP
jgi:hypothetical protein